MNDRSERNLINFDLWKHIGLVVDYIAIICQDLFWNI